ncbi:DUF3618 domain-containing protein [Krasilnikoviella flava]|uniref:DUF3618 domain-containing protein n=1 Tax=Krasilnikoviella flava TaxID=526729 RepID=A0A1T5LJ24_9MICO|nr:DUF3618 domain-containing protein [Krasilnikoviella flava]SKC75418.1 Protein of unknown function [Krasilnikoviella flava]
MTEPTTPENRAPVPTARELEDEVARTRAELGATLDQLATRLSPKYQANQFARATTQAASDAGAFVTGGGLPDTDARRKRNAQVLLGAAAAGLALVVITVVRARRR